MNKDILEKEVTIYKKVLILRTTSVVKAEKIAEKEKELSEKVGSKVVILNGDLELVDIIDE